MEDPAPSLGKQSGLQVTLFTLQCHLLVPHRSQLQCHRLRVRVTTVAKVVISRVTTVAKVVSRRDCLKVIGKMGSGGGTQATGITQGIKNIIN